MNFMIGGSQERSPKQHFYNLSTPLRTFLWSFGRKEGSERRLESECTNLRQENPTAWSRNQGCFSPQALIMLAARPLIL